MPKPLTNPPSTRSPSTRAILAVALALTLVGCAVPGTNQTRSAANAISVFPVATHWQALSRTASGITGDIALTDTKLMFANRVSINLEIIEHDGQTGQTLFKVTSKDNPKLLNDNLLCGSAPVDYLVTQISGDVPGQSDLQLMAYYYPEALRLSDLPLKDKDDINRQMCALYTYMGVKDKATAVR